MLGGLWRMLCDGKCIERLLCDGRYVKRVLCDGRFLECRECVV